MFGSTAINQLPSCHTYSQALNIWERAQVIKNSAFWNVNRRPLKDRRSKHYAVEREGDEVRFWLYRTPVVKWRGHTTCVIDSRYDSNSTRQFIWQFGPPGLRLANIHGKQCIGYDGLWARTGLHSFELQDGKWVISSAYEKPTRTVLYSDEAREVRKRLKPFTDWVKGIWAVSGDDGSHPYIGREQVSCSVDYKKIAAGDMEHYEQLAMSLCDKKLVRIASPTAGWNWVLCATPAKSVIANLYAREYDANNCYVKIPYDAEIPKRR